MGIILIAWVGCAFWCASIAGRTGRNTATAFCAGLCFGIFAVFHYSKREARPSTFTMDWHRCENCQNLNLVRQPNWRCTFCHTDHVVQGG